MLNFFDLKRHLSLLWLYRFKNLFDRDINLKNNISSEVKIDVLIPASEKDLQTLPYAIDGIRSHVKHPLGEIIIVAPDSSKIKSICTEKYCKFIDERDALPITKEDINYRPKGKERSGWVLQQLIKLNGDNLSRQKYYLSVDADTVLIRPHIFIYEKKMIINHSAEYYKPYFESYQKLLGLKAKSCLSFISHYMLFDRLKVSRLKEKIQLRHGTAWYKAILKNIDYSKGCGFSEQETYGNYLLSDYPNSIIREYGFNLGLKRAQLEEMGRLEKKYAKHHKSLSFHSYYPT